MWTAIVVELELCCCAMPKLLVSNFWRNGVNESQLDQKIGMSVVSFNKDHTAISLPKRRSLCYVRNLLYLNQPWNMSLYYICLEFDIGFFYKLNQNNRNLTYNKIKMACVFLGWRGWNWRQRNQYKKGSPDTCFVTKTLTVLTHMTIFSVWISH